MTTLFVLVLGIAAVITVPAQPSSAVQSIPTERRTVVQNSAVANAQYLITPTLSSNVANALFVMPHIGLFNTPKGYAAAYNSKWGDFGPRRIAAGTRINFGNFECNQTTAQTLSDTGGGGNHCFGGTINSSGSAWSEGVAIVGNISGPGVYYGIDLSLNNTNPRASAVLYWANCIGPATCGTAFKIGRKSQGDFAVGLDLAAHNIIRATAISFAGTDHAVISGTSEDVLRIAGGGTAGGILLAGSSSGGRTGLIRIRPYATSTADVVSIDPRSGNISTEGKIEAARGFQLSTITVEHLPQCDHKSIGTMFFVTNASSITYRGIVKGGGRTGTNVTCDGGNWLYM